MADTMKFLSGKRYKLAGSGCTATAVSITLQSFADPAGNLLAITDFGSTGYGTLEPSTDNVELISFTGVTQNVNGTATLTGVTRGLQFKAPYTQDVALRNPHAGGVTFVISNTPAFYDELSGKDNDETITGIWTFTASPIVPTPTTDFQAATKKYADDLAIAGSPDASDTTKGILKLSIAPIAPTNPIAVGDNDTSATSSGSKVVRGTAGKIDNGWINGGVANGFATLDAGTLVVQNPTNATATPTASKIPISNGSAKLDEGWLNITNAQAASLTGGITTPLVTLHAHRQTNFVSTRDMTAASGSVTYAHGLGAIPNWVRIAAGVQGAGGAFCNSDGHFDRAGSLTSAYFQYQAGTGTVFNAGTDSVNIVQLTVGGSQTATISVDATNVTLAWTKAAAPTGTAYLKFEAGV